MHRATTGLALVLVLALAPACDDSDGDGGDGGARDGGALDVASAGDGPVGAGVGIDGAASTPVPSVDAPASDVTMPAGDADGDMVAPTVPPAPPPATTGIDKLATELGAALCEKVYQCCGDAEIRNLLGPRIKMANCAAIAPLFLTGGLVELTYALTENHVGYRGEHVPVCLSAFKARSCADFAATLAATPIVNAGGAPSIGLGLFDCPDLIEPKQAPGQLCEANYECVASDCRESGTGDKRCRARSRVGESCSSEVDCVDGLVCAGNVCRMRGTAGESCLGFTGFCAEGLYCSYDSATATRTCQPKLDDGAMCSGGSSESCKSGRCSPMFQPTGPTVYVCGPTTPPPPRVLRCSGR